MTKPEVKFTDVIGWVDAGERGISARLRGVEGHPHLGDEPGVVRTSLVSRIERGADGHVSEIETLNTLYVRR